MIHATSPQGMVATLGSMHASQATSSATHACHVTNPREASPDESERDTWTSHGSIGPPKRLNHPMNTCTPGTDLRAHTTATSRKHTPSGPHLGSVDPRIGRTALGEDGASITTGAGHGLVAKNPRGHGRGGGLQHGDGGGVPHRRWMCRGGGWSRILAGGIGEVDLGGLARRGGEAGRSQGCRYAVGGAVAWRRGAAGGATARGQVHGETEEAPDESSGRGIEETWTCDTMLKGTI
jgi:hypothetical protein